MSIHLLFMDFYIRNVDFRVSVLQKNDTPVIFFMLYSHPNTDENAGIGPIIQSRNSASGDPPRMTTDLDINAPYAGANAEPPSILMIDPVV